LLENEGEYFLRGVEPFGSMPTIPQKPMGVCLIVARAGVEADPSKNMRAAALQRAHSTLDVVRREANLDWPVRSNLQEVDIAAAHGIPQSLLGASAPHFCSADFMIAYVVVGNLLRHFHVGTADALARLVNSLTASGPPSLEMTCSTVWRRSIMMAIIYHVL
jgi:hypothetical protein